MAATVYCASNTAFHQHSLTNSRAQFSPVLRRTSLLAASPLVPTAAIPSTEQPVVLLARKGDENNNDDYFEDSREGYLADDFPMTRDDADPTGNDHEDEPDLENLDDAEEFLSLIGLRPKMKQSTAPSLSRRPLTQRLASPVCLLPLPKYVERVRQALYVRLPFLKFLSTVTDVESFCSTDASAKAQSLLPRSAAQTRALSSLFKGRKKRKLAKTGNHEATHPTSSVFTIVLVLRDWRRSISLPKRISQKIELSGLLFAVRLDFEKSHSRGKPPSGALANARAYRCAYHAGVV